MGTETTYKRRDIHHDKRKIAKLSIIEGFCIFTMIASAVSVVCLLLWCLEAMKPIII